MVQKSQILKDTERYIKFLKSKDLLTDEHALTVSLIRSLAEEWGLCTSSTQRAAISKEIRASIDMLPHTEAPLQDSTQNFLDELESL